MSDTEDNFKIVMSPEEIARLMGETAAPTTVAELVTAPPVAPVPAPPPTGDRLPPHSVEAEASVLGSILMDPQESLPACIEALEAGAAMFYDGRHSTIYDAMLFLHGGQKQIDQLTLQQLLKDRGQLDKIGGSDYLEKLINSVPILDNLSFYIDIVREKSIRRSTLQFCRHLSTQADDPQVEMDEMLDGAETQAMSLRPKDNSKHEMKTGKVVQKVLAKAEEWKANQGKLVGLPTGLIALDVHTQGLQASDVVVIAGRPGNGKTSLAMQIAEYLIVNAKEHVGVFSLEMTSEALMLRMISARAGVDSRKVKGGNLNEDESTKFSIAANEIYNAESRLLINDRAGQTIGQIRSKIRRWKNEFDIKLAVIDHLGLIQSDQTKKSFNREQEVAKISTAVKGIAKDLNIVVILLVQISREVEKGPSRKPRMSDLRESGAIEQDADLIAMLYKPEKEKRKSDNHVNALFTKHRGGPLGDVPLDFVKYLTRFYDHKPTGVSLSESEHQGETTEDEPF